MTHRVAHSAPLSPDEQGFPDSETNQTRDNIASRCQALEAQFPRTIDLLAEVLAAMRPLLAGVASQLAGLQAPQHFREMFRGIRSMSLAELCRLASDPRREARDAVAAALSVLARAVDYRVVPEGRAFLSETVVGSALAEHAGVTLGLLVKALKDGRLNEDVKSELLPAAVRLQEHAADFVALCQPRAAA